MELLQRIINHELTVSDIKNRRGNYMSRISENIDSRNEFSTFGDFVKQNAVTEYLQEKPIMDSILKSHLVTNTTLNGYFN